MADNEEDEANPWHHSDAKKLLIQDIKDGIVGTVESGLHPSQVYVMRPEYAEYDYSRFVKYLYDLRLKYDDLRHLAYVDDQALSHDLALGLRKNSRPYPIWQGSEAERLLKEDLDAGADLVMKPAELRASRPEYLVWPLDVFRNHIHQELRARRERPYWMARKQKKEEEKRKQAVEKAKNAKKKAAKKAAKEAASTRGK